MEKKYHLTGTISTSNKRIVETDGSPITLKPILKHSVMRLLELTVI